MQDESPDLNTARPRRRARSIAALGIGLATVLAALAPATAQADIDQNTIMRNWATGVCLDSDNSSVYVGGCNGGIYQDWFIRPYGVDASGDVVVMLVHTNTNLCLEGSSDSSNTSSVAITPCYSTTDDSQFWAWTGDSTVGQYHNLQSGACLDTNGTSAYTQGCNGGQNQNWRQGF